MWHKTAKNGTNIVNFAYGYDSDGNITSQMFDHRTSDPVQAYTYDILDRLTRAEYIGGQNEQFAYDKLGKRLTLNNRAGNDVAYTHNVVNECSNLVTSGGTKINIWDSILETGFDLFILEKMMERVG